MTERTNVKDITGKSIEELTDNELAILSEQVETRRKNLRDALEKEHFCILATSAKKMVEALGLERLPKITLTPDATGEDYEVSLASVVGVKTPEKRAAPDVNGGAITIKKIGVAMGGIAKFKDKAGKEYNDIKSLIKTLKQPDGKPESNRCWDISKKGISSSDIVVKYHADEVTLVYTNGDEQLVKDAVEQAEKARAVA